MLRIRIAGKDVPKVMKWSPCLVGGRAPGGYSRVPDPSSDSPTARDGIIGYRPFLAVVVAAYFTLIALTPRTPMMPEVSWAQLLPPSLLHLALGILGLD